MKTKPLRVRYVFEFYLAGGNIKKVSKFIRNSCGSFWLEIKIDVLLFVLI